MDTGRSSTVGAKAGVEGRVGPRAAIVISIIAPALIETRDHTLTMARTFNGLRSPFLKERRRSYRTVSYLNINK